MVTEFKYLSGLDSATRSGESGEVKEWTLAYLAGEGDNQALAQGIEYHGRYFLGPQNIELSRLHRIAGPEPDMLYPVQRALWEETVSEYARLIQDEWSPPPLVVVDFVRPGLVIGDGNKRYEALLRTGKYAYPSIFCLKYDPRIYNLGR